MDFSMYTILCDACEDCSHAIHYKSICYDINANYQISRKQYDEITAATMPNRRA